MLPFGEASLKQNKKMKTYITPNTEYMETLQCFAICDPSAGKGVMDKEKTPEGTTPLGAPGRRVF